MRKISNRLRKEFQRDYSQDDNPSEFLNLAVEQQAVLLEAIKKHLKKGVTINRNITSYGLKCYFEDSVGYISNGAFKGAMIVSGFTPYPKTDRNPNFNVTNKSVNKLRALADEKFNKHK